MSLQLVGPLIVFAVLFLLVTMYVLSASGHFPRPAHAAQNATVSPVLLWGASLAAVVALVTGIAAAGLLMPWYADVIAGGAAVLAAPLVLQRFSDRFVDGRGALLTFAGGALIAAVPLAWLAAAHLR